MTREKRDRMTNGRDGRRGGKQRGKAWSSDDDADALVVLIDRSRVCEAEGDDDEDEDED